jgi:NodT family efflux transporter outer membrane factor (OMF) lipoprotein
LTIVATALALAGCVVGPDYHAPRESLSAGFNTGMVDTVATSAPGTQPATRPDVSHWWQSLGDAELDSLVDRAVQNNIDLKIALTRLQEARATEYVISGGTLPYLEGSGAAARGSGTNSTKGRVTGPLNAATNTTGLKEITQVVGFDAGWEIDLWGRFRRELEAAAADTQAVAEIRNFVFVTLVADVARGYMDMRTAQLRLAIAQANIATAQQTFDLAQGRFQRGLTNELDVALARRQLAIAQSKVAPLTATIGQAQRRVAVLLGLQPDALYEELQATRNIPEPPDQLTVGVPADLLRRRPDIRQAERQLAAETARIGVATADLFPRVAITAGFGLQGQGLGRTPTSDSLIWSAGPAAIVPILDFGRIDSMIHLEDMRTQSLLLNYRRVVLNAVQEVDDAVSNYAAQRDQLLHLSTAIDASQRAVTLAMGRYERGLIDFLNVLDAQRQLYDLEDQYTIANEASVLQFVALYKALGGGWESYQSVPPLRTPLPAIIAAGAYALGAYPQTPASQDQVSPAVSHPPAVAPPASAGAR